MNYFGQIAWKGRFESVHSASFQTEKNCLWTSLSALCAPFRKCYWKLLTPMVMTTISIALSRFRNRKSCSQAWSTRVLADLRFQKNHLLGGKDAPTGVTQGRSNIAHSVISVKHTWKREIAIIFFHWHVHKFHMVMVLSIRNQHLTRANCYRKVRE